MKFLGWKLINTGCWKSFLLLVSALLIFIVFVWLFVFTQNQSKASVSPPPIPPIATQIPSASLTVSPPIQQAIAYISGKPQTIKNFQIVKVIRVIDGDTIEIEGGKKVRYIGVDTPELTDKRAVVKCFADRALAKNKELVEGSIVSLIRDISQTDRYKRLLRYVYKEDMFINELLVQEGYAYAASFPPDIAYQEKLNQAQREAREKKLGLWGNKCM